jgi:hypothetical protein
MSLGHSQKTSKILTKEDIHLLRKHEPEIQAQLNGNIDGTEASITFNRVSPSRQYNVFRAQVMIGTRWMLELSRGDIARKKRQIIDEISFMEKCDHLATEQLSKAGWERKVNHLGRSIFSISTNRLLENTESICFTFYKASESAKIDIINEDSLPREDGAYAYTYIHQGESFLEVVGGTNPTRIYDTYSLTGKRFLTLEVASTSFQAGIHKLRQKLESKGWQYEEGEKYSALCSDSDFRKFGRFKKQKNIVDKLLGSGC